MLFFAYFLFVETITFTKSYFIIPAQPSHFLKFLAPLLTHFHQEEYLHLHIPPCHLLLHQELPLVGLHYEKDIELIFMKTLKVFNAIIIHMLSIL